MRGTAQILAKRGSGSGRAGKDERDERTNETRAGRGHSLVEAADLSTRIARSEQEQGLVLLSAGERNEAAVSSASDAAAGRGYLPTEHVQGVVERVTYHAEDSGYTVARLKIPAAHELITIVGSFPAIHAGQTLRLTGYYREHAKYGQQFQVTSAQETKPATLTGLEKYLGSGLIKGIGPVTAKFA